MTDLVTLIDGREMPAGCWLVKAEREAMDEHMGRMWALRSSADRRVYLSIVERSQGKAWADALKQRFGDEWEAKKKEQQA